MSKWSHTKRFESVPGPATGGSGLWDFFGSSRSFSSCLRVLLCRASLNMGKAWAADTQEEKSDKSTQDRAAVSCSTWAVLSYSRRRSKHTSTCWPLAGSDPPVRRFLPRCTLACSLFHITLHLHPNKRPPALKSTSVWVSVPLSTRKWATEVCVEPVCALLSSPRLRRDTCSARWSHFPFRRCVAVNSTLPRYIKQKGYC